MCVVRRETGRFRFYWPTTKSRHFRFPHESFICALTQRGFLAFVTKICVRGGPNNRDESCKPVGLNYRNPGEIHMSAESCLQDFPFPFRQMYFLSFVHALCYLHANNTTSHIYSKACAPWPYRTINSSLCTTIACKLFPQIIYHGASICLNLSYSHTLVRIPSAKIMNRTIRKCIPKIDKSFRRTKDSKIRWRLRIHFKWVT